MCGSLSIIWCDTCDSLLVWLRNFSRNRCRGLLCESQVHLLLDALSASVKLSVFVAIVNCGANERILYWRVCDLSILSRYSVLCSAVKLFGQLDELGGLPVLVECVHCRSGMVQDLVCFHFLCLKSTGSMVEQQVFTQRAEGGISWTILGLKLSIPHVVRVVSISDTRCLDGRSKLR